MGSRLRQSSVVEWSSNGKYTLLVNVWNSEQVPSDLKDARIISIFKKGDAADCGNYRGISLLSVVGKALSWIIHMRLSLISEQVLPESQSGFRPSRSTIDMIFTLRQLQEKCREQQRPLYVAFYDLNKAFNSVHRETLWQILKKYG